jgi:glycosyltransferase involved in cell wall biosynthesis
MNILELCLSPDLGGLELYVAHTAAALSRRFGVIPVAGPNTRLHAQMQAAGMAPRVLRRSVRALPLLAARRLARMLDEEKIDAIHVHWTRDLPLAVLAKVMSQRRPMLVSTRHMQITRPKRDPYHDFLYRNIDLTIAVTRALADNMRRCLHPAYGDRVTYLYSGVAAPEIVLDEQQRRAVRSELGVSDQTLLVGLIGRISQGKGQHLLIDALCKALDGGEDVAGLVVGHAMETAYLAELKQRVTSRQYGQRIVFRDFVPNPQRLMQACDVIVLTSAEETFGLVLAEAMRAGVAVVGSDRGGVLEIIDHDATGLLFRSGDSEDLHRQLIRLLREPRLRARLAQAGKDKADRLFDADTHYQQLGDLLARKFNEHLSAGRGA